MEFRAGSKYLRHKITLALSCGLRLGP